MVVSCTAVEHVVPAVACHLIDAAAGAVVPDDHVVAGASGDGVVAPEGGDPVVAGTR
jgi:hypothetical protein